MTVDTQGALSRRELLKVAAGSGAAGLLCQGEVESGPLGPEKAGDSAPPASEYSTIRGFNYQPSYAAHGLDIWRRFDAATIEKEISRGKKHFPAINTLRLWLSWEAFLAEPAAFARHFDEMLAILQRFQLRAIVTIFNAWRSIPDFGGVSRPQLSTWKRFRPAMDGPFLDYINAVVGGHADDDRVLLWDLCNEPPKDDLFIQWLTWVYETCGALRVRAPICVGNMPILEIVKAYEHLSDVLTWHPYWAWNTWRKDREDYIRFLDDSVQYAASVGKPLLSTECCWGAADDRKRAEVIEFELAQLKARGIGWTAHLLHDTKVADGHRSPWSHTAAGYMAFIEADGSRRGYHEVFNDF
jgi:hypothetical protein